MNTSILLIPSPGLTVPPWLDILDYPVGRFDGRKYIVLAEVSWLGGKNLFLGIAYLVTGVLAVIAGIILLVIHLCFSRW